MVYRFTDEHRKKLREARANRVISDITKKRISVALKGRKKSKEHRRKLSEANTGKVLSEEHRRKISEGLKGKFGFTHNSWAGGGLSYWKKAVKKRDGKCIKCGITDMRVLTADHIKSKSIYPELKFDVNNGMTLCCNCHAIKTLEDKEYRDYMTSRHWHKK